MRQLERKELTLQLMVRNKSNISIKVSEPGEQVVMDSILPRVDQAAYSLSRVRLADEAYLRGQYQAELAVLESNLKFRQSCAEEEVVPYVLEALVYCKE